MSSPFLIFYDENDVKAFVDYDSDEKTYFINLTSCLTEVWDSDIADYLNMNNLKYRDKLREFGGLSLFNKTYFNIKEEAETALIWIQSIEVAMKLGEK